MVMDLAQARERMVVEQLERRGIRDSRVLDAMRMVERDRFIPTEYATHAYDDEPLPIGADQTISQPYMVALMCEVAQLRGVERVLDILRGELDLVMRQCGTRSIAEIGPSYIKVRS